MTKNTRLKPLTPDQLRLVAGGDGEVAAARDAASGLPTGKRVHKPMVMVREE